MAFVQCDFFSQVLGLSVSMNLLLPQQGTAPFQTLYLLHGLSDDHTIWMRRTALERYVENLPLAVVMPAVGRSFYADMHQGLPYWTFISQELPELARRWFPLSARREDNFVAGLSMGGYGAFKLALSCPERFAAAASLSGALDVAAFKDDHDPALFAELIRIFGPLEDIPGSSHDLLAQLEKVAQLPPASRPALFQYCGREDFLYQENQNFLAKARALGVAVDDHEEPGDHQWLYWDRWIQKVLAWLPLAGR